MKVSAGVCAFSGKDSVCVTLFLCVIVYVLLFVCITDREREREVKADLSGIMMLIMFVCVCVREGGGCQCNNLVFLKQHYDCILYRSVLLYVLCACVYVCVSVIEQLSVFLKTCVGTEAREILKRVTNDSNKSFYGNPIKN